jgi:hypothetical protein
VCVVCVIYIYMRGLRRGDVTLSGGGGVSDAGDAGVSVFVCNI